MGHSILILVLSALAWAQTAAPNPAVNLNDSDNARKARALLNQTIQALGGQAYLTYRNKNEVGRYYPLFHGQSGTAGLPFSYYVAYPDRDRFEVLRQKDIHVIPGTIDIGGIHSSKADVVLIHNGLKGYETTYKGTAPQDPEDLAAYLRRRAHSLDWVFRKWINDPGVALFYDGIAVIEGKAADQVTLLNSQDDSVTLFLDQNGHLPIKTSYSWRDPKDQQKNTEEEVYDNYKLVDGVVTPYSVTRKFNGEMSYQRFINRASYNLNLPDSMFEATVNYDPNQPPPRKR